MNDPRDFLALAHFGNLGVLLLGIGLLGVLIHERPVRKWLSATVGFLGVVLLGEGAGLFHGATASVRGSVVVALFAIIGCVVLIRSGRPERSPESSESVEN